MYLVLTTAMQTNRIQRTGSENINALTLDVARALLDLVCCWPSVHYALYSLIDIDQLKRHVKTTHKHDGSSSNLSSPISDQFISFGVIA